MTEWIQAKEYQDITYHKADGMARIAFNRPEVRNAFRPTTVFELIEAFSEAWEDQNVGVVLFTGNGPAKDGKYAFCSGGDQKVRGESGYVDDQGVDRLNVLQLQRIIRSMPKPVIALVAGYAIGGGHVLHVICDLSIAADNAIFGQTGPKVGSFDGGLGSSYLARIIGQGAHTLGVIHDAGAGFVVQFVDGPQGDAGDFRLGRLPIDLGRKLDAGVVEIGLQRRGRHVADETRH